MAKSRKAPEPDPIFVAIAEHKSRGKEWARLEAEINSTQEAAESEKGKQCEQAWRAWEREGKKLARMKPTTPAGAAALIAYIRSFIMDERECGEWAMDNWTMPALKTVAASLAEIGA